MPDDWYGTCIIDITYDPVTGTGASCELVDVATDLWIDSACPDPACVLDASGFCYDALDNICI
jgi:hypothetical protein